MTDEHDEDLLEQLYWEFDAQRKKTGDERISFKGKMRFYADQIRARCAEDEAIRCGA